jgi:hypothetical protein
MPEPLPERLSRFTPDGTALDRDALLFAAGRASVRPSRHWAVLAGLLAASQVVSLVLLWPSPMSPVEPGVGSSSTPEVAASAPPAGSDAADQAALNRRVLESPDNDLPPPRPVDALVPSDPPLYAFASPPPGGLD